MIIAIDPGKSGGIAVYDTRFQPTPEVAIGMPETDGDFLEELQAMARQGSKVTVIIEKVGGFIGVKGKGMGTGPAMFNFGDNYGFIRGVCQALGFRIHLVTPQKWQKALGLGTRNGSTPTQWKNKLKAEAQRLNPGVKVTLQTADALLILEYARRARAKGEI